MNFLLSANNNYILPLTVCLTSILENHKNNDFNIYILQNDFSEENKNIIHKLFNQYNQKLHIIDVASHYYNNVPVLRWSKETYYRLLFNELLPTDINRLLYLDCDIIVNKNIRELYDINLSNNYIAAFPEENNFREKIGLSKNGKYFQAGVILFDINKCRPVIDYEKSIEIINKLGPKMIAVDQDIINIIFDGKILEIDEKFNNCRITRFYDNNLYRLLNITNKKKLDDTFVFHYASGKPWNNIFSGDCERIWNKYLLLSPFSNLYKEKYNTLKYKILRLGIFKYLFYIYIHITPIIEKVANKIFPKNIYNKLKIFYRKNIK